VTIDPDEILVARAVAGDARAFEALVERYRHRVFRLAVSILGPQFDVEAEDVTQDVFLRVHHALATFRGDSKFGSWIYRITFNLAVNLKSRVRFKAPHLSDETLAGLTSDARGPGEQLEHARRDRALEACVADLPEVYQAALRLHYWMGESVADVATLLEVPENTVKSYLHRARRLLRVMLNEKGHHDV